MHLENQIRQQWEAIGTIIQFFNFPRNLKQHEILSSHGGEYDVQSFLLGYTAM
jgi:hypothetical protein